MMLADCNTRLPEGKVPGQTTGMRVMKPDMTNLEASSFVVQVVLHQLML